MTVVSRRKPKPKEHAPWPSQAEPVARFTTEGKVSSSPSPTQAMWGEAIGRAREHPPSYMYGQGEIEGLCVGLAILTCQPLEEIRAELERKAHVR